MVYPTLCVWMKNLELCKNSFSSLSPFWLEKDKGAFGLFKQIRKKLLSRKTPGKRRKNSPDSTSDWSWVCRLKDKVGRFNIIRDEYFQGLSLTWRYPSHGKIYILIRFDLSFV